MEKKDGASCDPGWNDPPMFSYESQSTQLKTARPRTFLNKRVSFPLNEVSTFSTSYVDPTAPLPACNITSLPPPPSIPLAQHRDDRLVQNKNIDCNVEFDESKSLEIVVSNLTLLLNKHFQNEEKDKNDIQRRIDIMKKMWSDNKLCKEVQEKLVELSEALVKGEIEKADHSQKVLMVDHAPACSVWISGIRRLIHCNLQAKESNLDKQD